MTTTAAFILLSQGLACLVRIARTSAGPTGTTTDAIAHPADAFHTSDRAIDKHAHPSGPWVRLARAMSSDAPIHGHSAGF